MDPDVKPPAGSTSNQLAFPKSPLATKWTLGGGRGDVPPGPHGNGIEDTGVEGQLRHPSAICVHDEDVFVATVARAVKGDMLAVRGPRGIVVVVEIARELGDAAAVGVHEEDVEVAAVAAARKDEPLAVR